VNSIIDDIKKHAVSYFNAIDLSIKSSENGAAFAADASSVCGYLRDRESRDDIVSFIRSMQATAQKSHKEAEDTLVKFREIRTGLLQVSHCLAYGVLDHS
jgi:hypothetical protein